jgi:hypothetical protein
MAKSSIVGLTPGCTVKQLPAPLAEEAAARAVRYNRANAVRTCPGCPPLEKGHLAVLTQKYWGAAKGVHLGVSFLDTSDQALINKILLFANEWGKYGNVKFSWSQSDGEVRIARAADGYWSYLGPDILSIPKGQPTMNLQGFTLNTADSEYSRVVTHEFGHTAGFPHEHSRPAIVQLLDPAKTIAYFKRDQGWSEQTVRDQILTAIPESQLKGSAAEIGGIMCYDFPASITKNGKAIIGGTKLTDLDKQTVAALYPLASPRRLRPRRPAAARRSERRSSTRKGRGWAI